MVVYFEQDLCISCFDNKKAGILIPEGSSPQIMIGCPCDPPVNKWIDGIASLKKTEIVVLVDNTIEDFIGELKAVTDKLSIRRR